MKPFDSSKRLAPILWALLTLFLLRVIGQALVAFLDVSFLPPMLEWYSGLLPYRYLLPSQILIVALLTWVCVDFTRGEGFFVKPYALFATGVLWFGSVYFVAMVVRYALRMVLHPEARWFGGTIPIALHLVLASFVILFALYHRSQRRAAATPESRPNWKRRVAFFGVCLLVLSGAAVAIAYSYATDWLAWRLAMRPAEFPVRSEGNVAMLTSDGVPLIAKIFHPITDEPAPTLLVRIPLTKTLQNSLFASIVGRLWAERGYTVVIQGTRGRYDSGGQYYPLRAERADGIETLRWISGQPWFDGRLGMWGGSYFGYTQWVLADQVDPGPTALMVQLASTDTHAMFYPGGAFSLQSALTWALWSKDRGDTTPPPEAFQRAYGGFPLLEADDRAGEDIAFFNDWVNHPTKDEYWTEIDGEARAARSAAPVLLMAGWCDPFLPSQLEDFARIRSAAKPTVARASRLVIGPWAHAYSVTFPDGLIPENYRFESLAPSIQWFDLNLRHLPATPSDAVPVRVYVMGENVWRDESEWPLARTRYTSFFLHSGGTANSLGGDGWLSLTPPAVDEPSDRYVYDPHNPAPSAGGAMIGAGAGIALQNAIEARADVLVYNSPVLDDDLEITGPVKLTLYVSTSALNTDFTGKLVDVHPDGSAFNISDGILRRNYGRPSRRSMGRPVKIEIELWPTSMLVRKGHRLRLEVSSSNYPRYDRNPNTGGRIASETRPFAANQTIHHNPTALSVLVLPVIPRGGTPLAGMSK